MDADPQVLLNEKLADPSRVLATTESISLIEHCAQLGEQNAANANDKDVVMTLGNTGMGKSTFLNAILGCKMKLVKPGEVGTEGMTKVVIVDPESAQPEILPIGHEDVSKTFLPQIASEPNNPERTFCDCPGFLDNRSAEINIANAINTKRVLQKASGIKAVFLIDYPGAAFW
jgi:ribosome biogenesis GTPase A